MNLDSKNSTPSNNNQSDKKSKETTSEDDIYFYIMTLQADGERHQIKIFKNSNASELAFNFCKTNNMDFQTMKYLKKCIKKIILNFDNKRKNEMIYLLKDNSSIQEVAEEEIITDNSLKKSTTHKNTNSKNNNQKIDALNLQIKTDSINNKLESKNIIQKLEEANNSEKEKNITKRKSSIEEDDKINSKDYSIDYCLENDSVEVFQPTEHTTKIEQRSSIKNSSSMNRNKTDAKGKKRNSKNKKLQIINNNILMNKINKSHICPFILGKSNKILNTINTNELKYLIYQYNDKKKKEKTISKSKSKEKEIENNLIKKNNHFQSNKNNKSLEKIKKKASSKASVLDKRNNNEIKYNKNYNVNNNIKSNKYDNFLTNLNEMKNKYFSNYYDYFIKTKIINNRFKYQNSYSSNKETNLSKSKSISQQKIKKNSTNRTNKRNRNKNERNNISNTFNTINSINQQKTNNNISKLNLNTILRKEGNSKEKKRTVFKNKIKTKFSIILNKNQNLFNKTILTSRTKNGKELFLESKKKKKGIRKIVTESLLNIHKYKDGNKERKKNLNLYMNNNKVIKTLNNKSKNNKSKETFLKNDSGIEKSTNFIEKLYFDSGN
jgi:hypothetical protein